jgi:hypothetical protein
MPLDLDVVGIGNAIVDVMAPGDDAFLAHHGMTKGAMTLVDEARAGEIYAAMGTTVRRRAAPPPTPSPASRPSVAARASSGNSATTNSAPPSGTI